MIKSTKTDFQKLNKRIEKEIDYSDIPKSKDAFWDDSEVINFYKKKVDFTVSIDEDLAQWLKSEGDKSNQTLNNILREYYLINV